MPVLKYQRSRERSRNTRPNRRTTRRLYLICGLLSLVLVMSMSGCAASCPSLKEEPKPLPIDSVIDVYNWQSRVGNYSTRLKEQLNSASRTTNNVRRTIEK